MLDENSIRHATVPDYLETEHVIDDAKLEGIAQKVNTMMNTRPLFV